MTSPLLSLGSALTGLSVIQTQSLCVDAAVNETFLVTLSPDEHLVVARLPQSPSQSRHFISRDLKNFHELAVTGSMAKNENRSPIIPILTQTPGFLPMALVYDGLGLKLAYNRLDDPAQLETLGLPIQLRPDWIRGAAFFASPSGDAPAVEGALAAYWSQLTDPSKPMVDAISLGTFVRFVRGTAHALNNASSVLTTNTEFTGATLGALQTLVSALASSPEMEAALRKTLDQHPQREEMESMIALLNESLPPEARKTDGVLGLIASAAEDMGKTFVDVDSGARRIVAFTHRLQENYQRTDDATMILDPIVGIKDAEDYSKTFRAKAPTAEEPSVSPVTVPVLMVDDDRDLAELTADALRRSGFSHLHTAHSLREALEVFERNPGIQLVYTDFNLSETETGLDLVRLLKERYPGLKVVLATGNEDGLNEQMSAQNAVYEFFRKPVEMRVLAERLRKLLQ